jgi:hypothetical protein
MIRDFRSTVVMTLRSAIRGLDPARLPGRTRPHDGLVRDPWRVGAPRYTVAA